ncbi:MAG TPA: polysaccharide biosynthesis protein [Prolixibacteraceae bacterium]|nr:polysaccharide biosynthesis protein [Prolixibacteraceae bacterium]
MIKNIPFKIFKSLSGVFDFSLIKSTGIYTVSALINASIPFLLLPFLTKFLSRADFGVIFMFSTLTTFITPFINISMDGAITRVFYSDKNSINQYIGNCIIISITSTLLSLLLCLLISEKMLDYTSLTIEWVVLCIIYCFFQFMVLILLTLYRIHVKPFKYGALQIIQSALNLTLSLILIGVYNYKWDGRILAQVFSSFALAIVCFFLIKVNYKVIFKINFSFIKHALKFGGGLIPHALGLALIVYTNRFFLLNMVNIDETGLFGVASQLASVISFFTFSFNNAYVPWLYEKLSKNSMLERFKLVRFTYYYFVLLLFFGLIYYLALPILYHLFINVKFEQSIKYTPWLILGLLFQGMYLMVTNYIIYSEKTHFQAIVTIIVGVLNVPLTYSLIVLFGSIGAAVAFTISFFLLFILTWGLSAKVYSMPWFLFFKIRKRS